MTGLNWFIMLGGILSIIFLGVIIVLLTREIKK